MNSGLQITITGRSMNVRKDLKDYVQSKAGRLERYNDQLRSIEVVLSEQGDRRIAEMIAHPNRGPKVVGKAEHEDAFAAIDLLVDKMYQQLHKQKEKAEDRRKRSERVPPPEPSTAVVEEKLESYDEVVDKFGEKFD
ncbi:MAG: ribosome-associated translation inhibitor RaiA [Planctomycetes bacterium]|nr:ribosome-associated translation inhibitor RaiA [Planctomycetota bacterium]